MNRTKDKLRQETMIRDPENPGKNGPHLLLRLKCKVVAKIIRQHVSESEPWQDLLSAKAFDAIQRKMSGDTVDGQDARNDLRNAILKQIERSASRPRVLKAEIREASSGSSDCEESWVFVGPEGLVAVAVRKTVPDDSPAASVSEPFTVRTAYFPRYAAIDPRRKMRWKKAIQDVIYKYCPAQGGRYYLPDEEHSFEYEQKLQRGSMRIRRRLRVKCVRFFTLSTFGFTEESGGKGARWHWNSGTLQGW